MTTISTVYWLTYNGEPMIQETYYDGETVVGIANEAQPNGTIVNQSTYDLAVQAVAQARADQLAASEAANAAEVADLTAAKAAAAVELDALGLSAEAIATILNS